MVVPAASAAAPCEVPAWTLRDVLHLVRTSVPAAIAGPAALRGAERVARRWPLPASSVYLECRLGGETPRVDLLACVEAGGRGALPATEDGPAPPADRVLRAWTGPGGGEGEAAVVRRGVPLVWYEFDDVAQRSGPPSLLWCVADGFPRRPAPPERAEPVARAVQGLLALGRPAEALLRRCVRALPPGGRLLHLSAMTARQPPVWKLNVTVPAAEAAAFLRAAGWPGARAEVAAAVADLLPDAAELKLDLPADEGRLLPSLGLEAFDGEGVREDPGRTRLVDRCVGGGLCTPAEQSALRAWPGSRRERLPDASWPIRLTRWVDLKVVCAPGRLEAKAYLGVMPRRSLF